MIITAAYLSLLAAEPFVVGDLRTFADWTAGCDDRAVCHATSHPEETYAEEGDGPFGDGRLSVSIKAGPVPGEDPVVELALLEAVDPAVDAADLAVAIDGIPTGFRLSGGKGLFCLAGEDAQAFVAAAIRGKAVALVDNGGHAIGSASLRGLKGVMAFVDRQQYRIGTTSAFAVPGPRKWDYSVAPVLAPRAAVRVAAKQQQPPTRVTEHTIAQLQTRDPCEGSPTESPVEPPLYFRLDADHSLLILGTRCGGYNPYRMLFVVDEAGQAKAVRFWPFPGMPESEYPDLPDATWDEEARRLRTFGRGRVIADCGEAADYVWDRGAFRLVRFSSLYPCRGSFDYITTYDRPVEIKAE